MIKEHHQYDAIHYIVKEWLEENKKFFIPPVCNRMMHDSQLKVFYVGGPNQRRDYHVEEGEELFFMRKGDMCLKIIMGGRFVDVPIREGEIFLLPARIPHSPQRFKDTIGMVIERERHIQERDGLVYYVDDKTPDDVLYQRWFICEELGTQLAHIIKDFFASKQHETGIPIEEDLNANPAPWEADSTRRVQAPFNLMSWVDKHRQEIAKCGEVNLFNPKEYQSNVKIMGYGQGKRIIPAETSGEVFLWQLKGSCQVNVNNKTITMAEDDVLLVPQKTEYEVNPSEVAIILSTSMDPKNRRRVGYQMLD